MHLEPAPISPECLIYQHNVHSFEDGLRLVKLRGESMQEAANAAASGMVSVVGLSAEQVNELCKVSSCTSGMAHYVL